MLQARRSVLVVSNGDRGDGLTMAYQSELKGVEVSVTALYPVFESFKSFTLLASKIFLENGIGYEDAKGDFHFAREGWFPILSYLSSLEQVRGMFGARILKDAGAAVPRHATFPPQIASVEAALQSINIAYHMAHRLGGKEMFEPHSGTMLDGIGNYPVSFTAPKNATILSDSAYPCEYDHGIITSTAARFDSSVVVTHDKNAPCRNKGGRSCTYHVSW